MLDEQNWLIEIHLIVPKLRYQSNTLKFETSTFKKKTSSVIFMDAGQT